jgi:hypothetical protein
MLIRSSCSLHSLAPAAPALLRRDGRPIILFGKEKACRDRSQAGPTDQCLPKPANAKAAGVQERLV